MQKFTEKEKLAERRSVHSINVKSFKALREAVAKLIRERARTDDSVVIWRDGKVAWVPARQLLQRQRKK